MSPESGSERVRTSVGEEAGRVWRDAKAAARVAAQGQQRTAARSLSELAGALHEAADRTSDGKQTTTRVAHNVADGLERLAGTLRQRDLARLVCDVEDFARAQPLLFFGAAVATGFVAMRFLKSGDASVADREEQPGGPMAEPVGAAREPIPARPGHGPSEVDPTAR